MRTNRGKGGHRQRTEDTPHPSARGETKAHPAIGAGLAGFNPQLGGKIIHQFAATHHLVGNGVAEQNVEAALLF